MLHYMLHQRFEYFTITHMGKEHNYIGPYAQKKLDQVLTLDLV